MSDWPVTDKMKPRPVYARHVRRRNHKYGNGPPLEPPTDEEKRDAILILSDPYMWADEVEREAFRILDEEGRKGVYGEWCRDPESCFRLGWCPQDPTCAD